MTTTISSTNSLTGWLGLVAGPETEAYLRSYRPDFDTELEELIPPRFFSPAPAAVDGVHFDISEVDRFIRFCRKLRHIKGAAWAGRPFEPDLWQIVFVIAPLFGWRNGDGTRVYRTAWVEVPRKNGKSTLAAAINLYLLTADHEPGAEVVAAAGDREQARAVYDVSYQMAKASAAIRKRCRIGLRSIVQEQTASSYKVLSADAELKHGLNVSGGVIDEVHVHKNRKLIDTIETSTGSRTQPLIFFVTTAGVDDPGSIYTEKHDYAEKISRELAKPKRKPELEDPEQLVVIYGLDEGDDPFAESSWKKANPGYGKSLRPSYIATQARKARAQPAALNTFLRLHLNVRTGQVTRWLSLEAWDRSGAHWLTPTYESLKGRTAYAGLDLASTTDLAALALVIPRFEPNRENPDELIEVLDVLIRAWTPADTVDERAVKDRAPYRQWIESGHLIATPGNVIDYDSIELEAYKLAAHLELERLHFDRWGSKQISQHLVDGGLSVFEMGQGFASMSPPLKELERVILEERLAHAANPLLRWAVASLSVKQDPAGNIKPDRDKSRGRIDPFVALTMAIDAWSRDTRGESIYEERGMEVV